MKPKKDEEIKARVEGTLKSELWQIAAARHLDMSDVVREALREFVSKKMSKPQLA